MRLSTVLGVGILRGRATILASLVFAASPASAGLGGPPPPLEELARTADLICKATVIGDRQATDNSFEPIPGYEVNEAELGVVSIVKGAAPNVIRFRHYAPIPELSHEELVKALRGLSREDLEQLSKATPTLSPEKLEQIRLLFRSIDKPPPDTYTFAVGRTYLVVAAQTAGGAYRQLGKLPLFQGPMAYSVLLAADAKPHHGSTLSEAAWAEQLALLKSPVEDDVIGAIRNLDHMSGGPAWNPLGSRDFERSQALAAIQPLVGAKSVAIATVAITVFGRDSPYFEDPYEHELTAACWFVGIGKGHITGLAARNRPPSPLANIGAKELLQVATDGPTPEVRALAIRALGRRSHAYPAAMVAVWVRDPSIAVRRAGVT
jgi:hypothetical protein